jgi:hypothetical protein
VTQIAMQINIGNLDRSVRIVVGLVLPSLPFWLDSPWRWWGFIGAKPLIRAWRAAVRPTVYRLPGLKTCTLHKPQ